jgi:dTDP-4-dehydrorhamnose 3,5-epimerase
MRFVETPIPGVIVVEPDVHRDARGFFLETFHAAKYAAAGIPESFVQDNHSLSVRDTLRGLHMQVKNPQGKLVRVIEGEIWDVAVDVRPDSPTFGQWFAETLSADNFRQLYVPAGCAHGFCVLSDRAQVQYKCTELYDPSDEIGIAYNDPVLGIRWPVAAPILSDRDQRHGNLAELLGTRRLQVSLFEMVVPVGVEDAC